MRSVITSSRKLYAKKRAVNSSKVVEQKIKESTKLKKPEKQTMREDFERTKAS